MAMMMSTFGTILTLLEETDRIIKAQSSRGADFDTGNFLEKAKSFIPVLIPLSVHLKEQKSLLQLWSPDAIAVI